MILSALLVLSAVLLTASSDGGQSYDPGVSLAEWMARAEQRFEKLEAENRHLDAENQQLRTDIQKLKTGSMSKYHGVAARADDTTPLESVVTQTVQRLTEVSAEVLANAAKIQTLQTAVQEAGTSVYVRWGKSTCPISTSLVYSGVIGGSWYDHVGAAANELCLTLSPVLSDHVIPAQHSRLYGAEYATSDTHNDKDAVCAVCRSQRPTTVMVPGTNECMPGWTAEYSGFLMANFVSNHAGTEYICVDGEMEHRVGGDTNQNGVLLFYTATVCGSLPCSPYVTNKIVTCVVCSQ